MKILLVFVLFAFTQLVVAAIDPRLEQIDALRLEGKYPEAVELALAELSGTPSDTLLLNRLGELRLVSTGCSSWPAPTG